MTQRVRVGDAEIETDPLVFLVFEEHSAINVRHISAMQAHPGTGERGHETSTSITLLSGAVIDVPQSMKYVLGRIQVLNRQLMGEQS